MPLMMQSTVIELNISWFVMCIITHSSSKFVSLLILVVVSSTYHVVYNLYPINSILWNRKCYFEKCFVYIHKVVNVVQRCLVSSVLQSNPCFLNIYFILGRTISGLKTYLSRVSENCDVLCRSELLTL